MKTQRIEARILKGFRDILPADERIRSQLQNILQSTFQRCGFVPIDTPALEYTEILLGKGGGETDKQIYRFNDHGGRDVALRFDLTVPFARFMASHSKELQLPFKRYHIGKVFRGENTQRGRYREFTQCDFDIVGSDSLSADFEILQMMALSFSELHIPDVQFHISHRGLFNQLLRRLELEEQSAEILRLVDKLRKIGEEKVREGLEALSTSTAANDILTFIQAGNSNEETLKTMIRLAGGESDESRRLRIVLELASGWDLPAKVHLDPSITRGLDYYTGIVFETFLLQLPGIGSVCSGGRYNDLASLYSKEQLPGVGASIGLDRLIAGLTELDQLPQTGPEAHAIILCLDEKLLATYHQLALQLRMEGLRIDVYPEAKKLPKQFSYAEKRGIPFGIIIGEKEAENRTANLKNLITRHSFDGIALAQLPHLLQEYNQKRRFEI